MYAIYSIQDEATRTERFASYKDAYNFIYRESGSIKGFYRIVKTSS